MTAGQGVEARTGAEQAALAALRTAYPKLATRYSAALRQAQAVALGKLWIAPSRERLDGVTPAASPGRVTLLLPNGTRLSASPAIARESPERHAGDGEVALPTAALTARSPLTGRPLLADVFDEMASGHRLPLHDATARFLASYCDYALPALRSRWGVALEPHGQNTVVVMRCGLPVRQLYRDFGGVRVSRARLARRGLGSPTFVGGLPTEDEGELRAKLFFPLIDTNLSPIVAALARVGERDPGQLWRLVARRCRAVYVTLTADPAIRAQAQRDEAALFSPTIPVKSMLRTQMSATPHAAQWVAVPNPLTTAG